MERTSPESKSAADYIRLRGAWIFPVHFLLLDLLLLRSGAPCQSGHERRVHDTPVRDRRVDDAAGRILFRPNYSILWPTIRPTPCADVWTHLQRRLHVFRNRK